jgi:hypothetical protein
MVCVLYKFMKLEMGRCVAACAVFPYTDETAASCPGEPILHSLQMRPYCRGSSVESWSCSLLTWRIHFHGSAKYCKRMDFPCPNWSGECVKNHSLNFSKYFKYLKTRWENCTPSKYGNKHFH